MRSTTPHIRSSAAFRLVASVVLVAGVWLAAVSRWVVSDLVVRWDSKNQFYAFFRFLSAAVRAGQSEHRGPAIAGVQSGVRSLGASRSGTGDADVRSVRICSLISRRNQYRHNRLARAMANSGKRVGCGAVHVRRRVVWPSPAYRHYYHLRGVPVGVSAAATRASTAITAPGRRLCHHSGGCWTWSQPGGLAGLCVTAGGRGSRDISLGPAIVLFTGAIWRFGDELTSCRQG
jgi:hypothetical protein